jgi:DNA-binding MarR family transcriptional regulator
VSRGFDGFEPGDFRDSDWESDTRPGSHTLESFGFDRGSARGRGAGWSHTDRKLRLEQLRHAESAADRAVFLGHQHQQPARIEASRDSYEGTDPADRTRTTYTERERSYSLRPSEIQTLTEVGKFRVIAQEDLARFGYGEDRLRSENDVRNLVRQGLLQRHPTSVFKKESRQVLSLTKRGQKLIRENEFVPEGQAIYAGFVKPKEAEHDSALYRLYQKAAAQIERKGAKILGVQLDYELKEKLYRKLGEAQANGNRETQRLKENLARQMHLPVVHGKVSLPDLRIEYADEHMQISRVDVELATGHYHAGHLAEKARAGFQIYARPEDAAGLRRIRDDHEIMTAILSL